VASLSSSTGLAVYKPADDHMGHPLIQQSNRWTVWDRTIGCVVFYVVGEVWEYVYKNTDCQTPGKIIHLHAGNTIPKYLWVQLLLLANALLVSAM